VSPAVSILGLVRRPRIGSPTRKSELWDRSRSRRPPRWPFQAQPRAFDVRNSPAATSPRAAIPFAPRQEIEASFTSVDVLNKAEEVHRVCLGWSGLFTDARGRASVDLSLHDSPGGLGSVNSDLGFNT
jgi:hypothetical protein